MQVFTIITVVNIFLLKTLIKTYNNLNDVYYGSKNQNENLTIDQIYRNNLNIKLWVWVLTWISIYQAQDIK